MMCNVNSLAFTKNIYFTKYLFHQTLSTVLYYINAYNMLTSYAFTPFRAKVPL